jgi:hypothetical protein
MASCLTVSSLLACLLTGRQIEDWPYEKLFKRADLIVIVKPLEVRGANIQDDAKVPEDYQDYMTGVVTKFKVLHVVKGEFKQKNLAIFHLRMKEGKSIMNGPMLVSFQKKPVKLKGEDPKIEVKDRDYILFLKKDKDGRLKFVSGQTDPVLSVKEVREPWARDEE